MDGAFRGADIWLLNKGYQHLLAMIPAEGGNSYVHNIVTYACISGRDESDSKDLDHKRNKSKPPKEESSKST